MAHLGNRWFFTVLDLVHRNMQVQFVCRDCARREECSPAKMRKLFGLSARIVDAELRLRCRQCATRSGRIAIGGGRRA